MPKSSKNAMAADKVKEMDSKILGVMLMYYEDEKPKVKVEDVANELGLHPRNKLFRDRWSFLKNSKKFIGKARSGDGLELTKIGLDGAATPEYKERMKELAIVPKTNSEHQERIKKHLKQKKSQVIFDLLLKYGSLSKDDLSSLVGQQQRSHAFHYSLKELRVRGYVEEDPDHSGKGKKFRLSDKAFKAKGDRPKAIDSKELATEISKGKARIESQKQGPRSGNGKPKAKPTKVKKEEAVKEDSSSNGDDDVVDLVSE